MTWIVNDAGYPVWKPDTEYGGAPPVGGPGARFVDGQTAPTGVGQPNPATDWMQRLPQLAGPPPLNWMQSLPDTTAAADAAIGSWMRPFRSSPTLDPRTGAPPALNLGPSTLPSAAPSLPGSSPIDDLAGMRAGAQQVMAQNSASAAAAATAAAAGQEADPTTQALVPDPADPGAAPATAPATPDGQPAPSDPAASASAAPAPTAPAPAAPTPVGPAPAPTAAPAPRPGTATPGTTPPPPAAAVPPAKPQAPQPYAISPTGTVVVLKPGQRAPAGYSTVMLTPSAAQTIANGGRPPAGAAGAAAPIAPVKPPLDPGRALDSPDQGQIDQDSESLPTQNSPLGAFVNVDPMTAIAAANGIRMGQNVLNPADSAAIKAQYGSQTKALVQEISSGSLQGQAILKQVAQLAWYRQTKGQQGAPEAAPADYIASWVGAYRTGRLVQLGPSLDLSIAQSGMTPPAVKTILATPPKPAAATNGGAAQAGHAFAIGKVAQMSQYDQGQYNSAQQYQAWKDSACGAASFASMLNSILPEAKWTVGKGVDFLVSKGLISTAKGLHAGGDFTQIASAMQQAIKEQGGDPNAVTAVNMGSAGAVQQHFQQGGGAIMFTGPGAGGGWNYTHIYVVTGATDEGVNVVDSSNSQGGKTFITWAQWQRQSVQAGGAGAGVAITPSAVVAARNASPANTASAYGGPGAGVDAANMSPLDTGYTKTTGGKGGFQALPTGKDYIPAAIPHVIRASQVTGLAPELILAISINENGRNNDSALGREHNNYFGMKADPSWTDRGRQTVTMRTREERADGSSYWEENAQWRHYDDPAEGYTGLGDFLKRNRRYTEAGVFATTDPYEQVRRMKAAGYATDDTWVQQVHAIMNQIKPLFASQQQGVI